MPEMSLPSMQAGGHGSGRRVDGGAEEGSLPEVSPQKAKEEFDADVAHHRRRRRTQRHIQPRKQSNFQLCNFFFVFVLMKNDIDGNNFCGFLSTTVLHSFTRRNRL